MSPSFLWRVAMLTPLLATLILCVRSWFTYDTYAWSNAVYNRPPWEIKPYSKETAPWWNGYCYRRSSYTLIISGSGWLTVDSNVTEFTAPQTQDMNFVLPLPGYFSYRPRPDIMTSASLRSGCVTKPTVDMLGFFYLGERTYSPLLHETHRFSLPYWSILFLALPGILPLYRYIVRIERVRGNKCVRCGYNLRATPDRCPECGTKTSATATAF
jgi:hypothetical protein